MATQLADRGPYPDLRSVNSDLHAFLKLLWGLLGAGTHLIDPGAKPGPSRREDLFFWLQFFFVPDPTSFHLLCGPLLNLVEYPCSTISTPLCDISIHD